MTEYDVVDSSLGSFASSLLLTFIGFCIVTLVWARYIWPSMVNGYWKTAYMVYWAMRKCIKTTRGHNRSLYTGYTNNKEIN